MGGGGLYCARKTVCHYCMCDIVSFCNQLSLHGDQAVNFEDLRYITLLVIKMFLINETGYSLTVKSGSTVFPRKNVILTK